MSKISLAVAIVAAMASPSVARPEYRERIPNSMNVKGVDALGHDATTGGGPRNAFGKDFDASGRQWTTTLCQKDSDGDGQTNGQELGDPCCAWVQSSNEKLLWTTGVSAPGDAESKSDATKWANVTCASTTPAPSKGNTANLPTRTSGMAIAAVLTVMVVNAVGL